MLLWQSALCWMGDNPNATSFILSRRAGATHRLMSHTNVDSVEEMAIFRDLADTGISLCLPADFDMLPSLARTRILSRSGNRRSAIERFPELGDRVNIARSVGGPLDATLRGPPNTPIVALYSVALPNHLQSGGSPFGARPPSPDGRTFRNYIGRRRKGRILPVGSA